MRTHTWFIVFQTKNSDDVEIEFSERNSESLCNLFVFAGCFDSHGWYVVVSAVSQHVRT